MNAFENLLNIFNSNSTDKAERAIAQCLLENLNMLEGMTIYDLAEMSYSSRASVWRMVRKMGYHSFGDFRRDLTVVVSRYNYNNRQFTTVRGNTPEQIRDAIAARMRQAADAFSNALDLEYAERIVEAVHRAEAVHFYVMVGDMQLRSFQQNLAVAGKRTKVFFLLPEMQEDAEQVDAGTLIVTNLLDSPNSLSIEPLLQTLRESGCTIVAAGTGNEQFTKYYDFDKMNLFHGSELARAVHPQTVIQFLSELFRIRYLDS